MHSEVEANVAYLLKTWDGAQPEPRGKVHSGEAGFRLRRDPDTARRHRRGLCLGRTGGQDATESQLFYDGPPVLAVEILSPSDKHEDIVEKIRLYLEAGVVVWVVDPDFRTVSVHRPGQLSRRRSTPRRNSRPTPTCPASASRWPRSSTIELA